MSSRKVRVKKLSVKTVLPVLREDQIDPSEYEALTTDNLIATGVEQAEENEYHLQTILKDAGTSNDQEIPVPPPQESDIDYDALYPSSFHQPSSYIRFSQTVEECISCQYDMTTEDDEFLKSYNGKSPQGGALSEDDFERIMEVFEDTATEQTPFASVDNTVVAYDMMVPGLNHLGSPTILQHAKAIYEYWKTRRQELGNKPLHPSLKFEMHQETDDTDPYVCFRRREARQTRKTRARDNKIAETLKRLRRELEDGRQLVLLSYEREMQKRELLHMDRALFEERARLKQMKVKLGIRDPDDDLVNQKPQKRKAAEPAAAQRPQGTQLRAPKERELREEIESKVQNHRRWNQNHIDLTREPLPPVKEQGPELKFRPAKTQYLMTPPASISSESMEVDEDAPEPMAVEKREPPVFQFKAGSMTAEQSQANQPAFRRRIGRLQRLWIDRRGMATPPRETSDYSDRWKYDSDDDEVDPPVYEIDPFDTRALKFRATIPLGQYMYRAGRPSMPPEAAGGGSAGNRALPPSQAALAAAAAAAAQAQAQTAS
ncbi:EPL1-like protein [Purpureocillium lilacinum]|uniref:Enhancer of polycomb-like protein n=1 Tax=Purpureocillium lilacinum TaxID=33203 RepID=A0A179GJT9_PURLI|nr:EPL1-like protein [Purpureocillium lilacinum]OAQ77593.1 EPL1-like protein [Purpureocillium lilacinum]OAQ85403.1 EPL1-like protein [Purpureocillium lilacinum]GJN74585.1 enhancer of polycomb-like protein 1 [Purpureocillium lilacinum]GJN86054.1 enhancer of polycomb-like protein 1 [Purpureocillium lilacinum]